MSKERLKDIDKRAKHKVLGNIEGEIKYRLTEINTEDYEWLIEQAERVQELEELVEGYKIELMIKDNAKKRANQQNKRYREALERIKDNVPLEFEHKSEYEAKKNVIRLMNIQKEVDEALEDEE